MDTKLSDHASPICEEFAKVYEAIDQLVGERIDTLAGRLECVLVPPKPTPCSAEVAEKEPDARSELMEEAGRMRRTVERLGARLDDLIARLEL